MKSVVTTIDHPMHLFCFFALPSATLQNVPGLGLACATLAIGVYFWSAEGFGVLPRNA